MLQTYTLTGTGRQIDAKGDYFRYAAGTAGGLNAAIRVRADGSDLGLFLPGDSIKLPGPATRWNIEPVQSSLRASVRVGLGEMASTRIAGSVTMIDAVAENCQFLAVLTPLAVAALETAQIIAPAANVNGAIIRAGFIVTQAGAGGTVNSRLIAAPTVPTGLGAINPAFVFLLNINATTTTKDVQQTEMKRLIPPGWGVWLGTSISGAAAASNSAGCSFELL